ncbi:protein-er retention protein [Niveomyces insectorum RCEF 264]|uniref:Protein-er retention protein n=1 Tax=Niveomyces insectorum RCEF 264 TaxID=1081102 RepID=A0A167TW86_9HYPO|nr:protein-er retention protein [Niveomyces insectorum RCEF 264]
MDGIPAVEPELDGFSLTLPLPYRVALMIVLATWGWGTNLHYLYLQKIDVPALIRYPGRASPTQDGRRRFAATLRRVAVGGLAEAAHGKFGDILLADVLTSYAKVLGDLYVCVCMFFFTSRAGREASATDRPDRNCGGAVIVPLILAAPSLARFRHDDGLGWGGQHLANAAKYASAFPVIAFAALQRRGGDSAADAASAASYHQAWILAVLVNSLYSFYWDVAKDWDLTLFEAARQEARNSHSGSTIRSEYPWGLRRRLHLRPAPLFYYAAIAVDLTLRLSWVLTLRGSSPADGGSVERTLFLVEVLEVVRRWLWIFFRVETEWVRGGSGGGGGGGGGSMGLGLGVGSSSGLNPTDILLGDYQGKYDDEDD